MTEHQVQLKLCEYLRLQYPRVIFASDFGAGVKLNKFQAAMQKMFKSSRGYPDIFIAEPAGKYSGLFIELKRDGARVWLKNGQLSTDKHIREQLAVLTELDSKGYCALFAVGFDNAKGVVDWYLRGTRGNIYFSKPATQPKEVF